jgi:hypothetical protein
MKPRVLIACEFSGTVRRAFAALGADAWSCDLLPSTDNSDHHITGDVTPLLYEPWDIVIAHPPCTYLANSGVRWLYNDDGSPNEERWSLMADGAAFFARMFHFNTTHLAVENPIMHGHARKAAGIGRPTQTIQPWQFGHGESKATCLWLRGLPELAPTNVVEGRDGRMWKMGPRKDRAMQRSITYPGIAKAMADQWMPIITGENS